MFRTALLNALIMGYACANPVAKVQELLQDLQSEKQKEADEQELSHKKYDCWCSTNREEKTDQIENADQDTKMQLATAKRLTAQAEEADSDRKEAARQMAETTSKIENGRALRAKEAAAFADETKTLRENIAGLDQALVALRDNVEVNAKPQNFQFIQTAVEKLASPKSSYGQKMQSDLLEVLAAFPNQKIKNQLRGEISLVSQKAAPFNSYGSQTGQVVGMLEQLLSEMKEEFKEAEDAEKDAIASFNKVQGSLQTEFSKYKQTKTQKDSLYAESRQGAATAREQAGIAGRQLEQNKKFLAALDTSCKDHNDMYSANVKARNQELKALGEALGVFAEDSVRDLFLNPPSFLQVDAKSSKNDKLMEASKILRKSSNLQMLQVAQELAEGNSQFGKLFEKFDNMVTHLKQQMKHEFEERDECNSAIHENKVQQADLENELHDLDMAIQKDDKDIESHNNKIEEQQAAMKENYNNIQKASDTREGQDHAFQASQDNGMKVGFVLKKVMATLQRQYASKKSFVQESSQTTDVFGDNAPPPTVSATQNGAAGGILGLLSEIQGDNQAALNMGVTDENKAQADYQEFLKDSFDSVNDSKETIDSLSQLVVSTQSRLDDNKNAQATTLDAADAAHKAGKTKVEQCSFLLKYFDLRQQKIQEEVDAIGEAKAILSGAK